MILNEEILSETVDTNFLEKVINGTEGANLRQRYLENGYLTIRISVPVDGPEELFSYSISYGLYKVLGHEVINLWEEDLDGTFGTFVKRVVGGESVETVLEEMNLELIDLSGPNPYPISCAVMSKVHELRKKI